MQIATAGLRTGIAMAYARGAVQVRDGGVRAPRPTDDKEICASPVRADVGIGPYGVFTDRIL